MRTTESTKSMGGYIGTFVVIGLVAILIALSPTTGAETEDTEVRADVGSVISLLTTDGTVALSLTPSADGVQSTASDTVTVSTNNAGGYNLSLEESTSSTALESAESGEIPAVLGTQASPTALTANTWGYRVDGVGGFGAGATTAGTNTVIGSTTYAAVAASGSPDQLKTTTNTATNDTTTVWYSAAVDTDTPSGVYTNDVTYTALNN